MLSRPYTVKQRFRFINPTALQGGFFIFTIMYTKAFSFSGITLVFRSEKPIRDSGSFPSFITCDEYGSVITVKSADIPAPFGTKVFEDSHHALYKDGNASYYYSSYAESDLSQSVFYAVLITENGERTLLVDYESWWDSMIFDALHFSSILLEEGAVLLHASCIDVGGEAIVFTAPKQVGKSTQAALWEKYEKARIINGDRIALRFIDDRLFACGTPYCGSSKVSEDATLPLKAVVCLEQGRENEISPLGGMDAFLRLFSGISCDHEDRAVTEKLTSLVTDIVESVEVLRFPCTPDESAVKKLKAYLNAV